MNYNYYYIFFAGAFEYIFTVLVKSLEYFFFFYVLKLFMLTKSLFIYFIIITFFKIHKNCEILLQVKILSLNIF